jgi:hypothetical protein
VREKTTSSEVSSSPLWNFTPFAELQFHGAVVDLCPALREARHQLGGRAGARRQEIAADQAVEHGIGDADVHIAHLFDGFEAAGQAVDGDDEVRTVVGGKSRCGEAEGHEPRPPSACFRMRMGGVPFPR